jgi:hypothetical protein
MNADRPTPPRRSRARTLLRWGRGILILAVIGVTGKFVEQLVVRHLANEEVKQAVADLDGSEPGWTFDEIQARRKSIPDEKNGAKRVVAAFKLMPHPWPAWRDAVEAKKLGLAEEDRDALNDSPWQNDPRLLPEGMQLEVLRSELKRAEAALKAAQALEQCPDGRYDINYKLDMLNTLIQDTQDTRELTNLLELNAIRKVAEGDVEGACRNAFATLQVGRSHGDEIILIVQLVRIAQGHIAVHMLERALTHGTPSKKVLWSLQDGFEREANEVPELMLGALRGERALVHRMLEAYADGQLSLQQALSTSGKQEKETAWNSMVGYFGYPFMRRGHADYLRRMTELIESAKLPAPEQQERGKEIEQQLVELKRSGDRSVILSGLFLPAVQKVLDAGHRQQAVLRCAATALAAERYRQEKGNWPGTLDTLVPTYLKEVPTDPYDGKPLRLRRTDDGIIVYSIGPDQADDGGTLNRENPVAPGADLGFQLWDAGQRGRKPVPN